MSVNPAPKRSRLGAIVIVAVLAAVIIAVVIVGIATAAGRPTAAGTTTPPVASTSVPTQSTTTSASPSTTPKPTASSTPKATGTPKPQPTRTTAIASSAPIAEELSAKVVKLEAVKGVADGPGEIAGPAVRFTITITNTTGKSVDLSNTVVNAYYGAASTPAVELQEPGGKPFPARVADGKTATGVFVYNIATADRKLVTVTVDTSVNNPVVAFKGPAPK